MIQASSSIPATAFGSMPVRQSIGASPIEQDSDKAIKFIVANVFDNELKDLKFIKTTKTSQADLELDKLTKFTTEHSIKCSKVKESIDKIKTALAALQTKLVENQKALEQGTNLLAKVADKKSLNLDTQNRFERCKTKLLAECEGYKKQQLQMEEQLKNDEKSLSELNAELVKNQTNYEKSRQVRGAEIKGINDSIVMWTAVRQILLNTSRHPLTAAQHDEFKKYIDNVERNYSKQKSDNVYFAKANLEKLNPLKNQKAALIAIQTAATAKLRNLQEKGDEAGFNKFIDQLRVELVNPQNPHEDQQGKLRLMQGKLAELYNNIPSLALQQEQLQKEIAESGAKLSVLQLQITNIEQDLKKAQELCHKADKILQGAKLARERIDAVAKPAAVAAPAAAAASALSVLADATLAAPAPSPVSPGLSALAIAARTQHGVASVSRARASAATTSSPYPRVFS